MLFSLFLACCFCLLEARRSFHATPVKKRQTTDSKKEFHGTNHALGQANFLYQPLLFFSNHVCLSGARLYEKNPELIERDMQRIVDVHPQQRHSNGGYELIYDIKRPIRHTQTSSRHLFPEEYRRPGSLKEMKADLARALQTILSEDIIDLGIR